ncbi:MAG TPA: adenosylhomocysteinase, partial [Bdellovibrionota bacterium]|nr:adenosylhomocysteinase [Bdellovibrionota bacterium]
ISDAAKIGDFFVTATGDTSVIRLEHFEMMKDGAIVCNSGHFNVELSLVDLEKVSTHRRHIREFIDEYTLRSGKRVSVLGEGRLVNLAAAEGHPSSVMDMSFANQALAAEYVLKHHKEMTKKVYSIPSDVDREIARLKLEAMGIQIDTLTSEQEKYLRSWESGT